MARRTILLPRAAPVAGVAGLVLVAAPVVAALVVATLVAVGLAVAVPGSARAQTPGEPTSTSTSVSSSTTATTDGSSTTTSVTVDTTSTTAPPSDPTTTVGPGAPPVPAADAWADAFLSAEDQDRFEALDGGGDARSGFYAAQPSFDPAVANAVLEAEVLAARGGLERARSTQQAAQAHEAATAEELAAAKEAVGALDGERRARVEAAATAEEHLRRRAVDAYVRGGGGLGLSVLVRADTAGQAAQRVGLLQGVLQADVAAARAASAAVDGLDENERGGADRLATARRAAADATEARLAADWERLAAESTLAMYEAGSHVAVAGFVFPVAGDVSFIDSYGASRNMGTGYEHWHEGTDVMAARDTPVVAVEDGVIERARPNSLGGNAVRLRGASGHGFYYAHLAGYAPGIAEGMPVTAGQLLGFVGDTGDARGGATHLHFEIHRPGTDEPVNPYPLLRLAWQARQAALVGQPPSSPMGQVTPVPPIPQ